MGLLSCRSQYWTPGEGAFRATCSHTARRAGWKRAEGEHLLPPPPPLSTCFWKGLCGSDRLQGINGGWNRATFKSSTDKKVPCIEKKGSIVSPVILTENIRTH